MRMRRFAEQEERDAQEAWARLKTDGFFARGRPVAGFSEDPKHPRYFIGIMVASWGLSVALGRGETLKEAGDNALAKEAERRRNTRLTQSPDEWWV